MNTVNQINSSVATMFPLDRGEYSYRTYFVLFLLAAISFFTTINLPHIGEEGVYTISTLEMWFNKQYLTPLLYGGSYIRPPMMNWLTLPLVDILGYSNVLIATRLVTIFSTIGTALVLIWFVNKLLENRHFAIFTGLIYLSGDLLFRRGWIAYADPVFAFFSFAAIASLWVGLEKRELLPLYLAPFLLIGAYLSKAFTVYPFYLTTLFIVNYKNKDNKLSRKPLFIITNIFALVFPILWSFNSSHIANHNSGMFTDILVKLQAISFSTFFKSLIFYPFDTLMRFMPASIVALCCIAKARSRGRLSIPVFSMAVIILFINYLPYWLAPNTRARYILSLYPLFAFVFSYIIWQAGGSRIRLALQLLVLCLACKFILGFWGYDYYEKKYRGDYASIATDIINITNHSNLYADDDSSTGLSVTAEIDIQRYPKPPITRPDNTKSGFVLSYQNDEKKYGKLIKTYQVGRNNLYLFENKSG